MTGMSVMVPSKDRPEAVVTAIARRLEELDPKVQGFSLSVLILIAEGVN
jgi:hypothetical protein